jgi:hypothetical protein
MATEKRLIDANYFVNKGIRNCPIEEGGIPLEDFHKHQKILELYPTVDAVEVVHGRWEHDSVGFDDYWKCSACGEDWFFIDDPTEEYAKVNYCPNCGATMDGDSK